MKILYYFIPTVMPLPQVILDTFDKVITNIRQLDELKDSLHQLSPDDEVIFSIHTCNGPKDLCECANDCGIDIALHLRKIDDEHVGSMKIYEYNRDVIVPEVLQKYGYQRIYFGADYDEK